jgi:hypothetical protein
MRGYLDSGMDGDAWQWILVGALMVNAVIGFVYRVYRLSKGGPTSDVIGQAALGLLLTGIAIGASLGQGWSRWAALVYGLLFGLIVMPLWVLAVLIPQRPERIDYAFTVAYWLGVVLIVVAAVLA